MAKQTTAFAHQRQARKIAAAFLAEDMQSKHAYILALLTGAAALLFVLGVFITLDLVRYAEPYLGGQSKKLEATEAPQAPKLITKLEGNQANIVEVDAAGIVIRTIYSSEIKDHVASFSLFAVPQLSYNGKAYVESVQDADSTTLIIYPLDVETGTLSAAVLNVPSVRSTLSPDQSRVAVISPGPNKNLTVYDLATGVLLSSWTLANDEWLTAGKTTRYTGDGVQWTNNNCFDHPVWNAAGTETRSFCVVSPSTP